MAGKILKKLKTSDILWKLVSNFQNKIKNHSFGVWTAFAGTYKNCTLTN